MRKNLMFIIASLMLIVCFIATIKFFQHQHLKTGAIAAMSFVGGFVFYLFGIIEDRENQIASLRSKLFKANKALENSDTDSITLLNEEVYLKVFVKDERRKSNKLGIYYIASCMANQFTMNEELFNKWRDGDIAKLSLSKTSYQLPNGNTNYGYVVSAYATHDDLIKLKELELRTKMHDMNSFM